MNNKNFRKLISNTPSKWKEKAKERVDQPWLTEYSAQIARRILTIINDGGKDLNQTKIAAAIGVERQYISKVIQGKENLSLQTIWKLSRALNFDLITFPEFKHSVKTKKVKLRNS